MRTYPHKPKESDLQKTWQEQLDTYSDAPDEKRCRIIVERSREVEIPM